MAQCALQPAGNSLRSVVSGICQQIKYSMAQVLKHNGILPAPVLSFDDFWSCHRVLPFQGAGRPCVHPSSLVEASTAPALRIGPPTVDTAWFRRKSCDWHSHRHRGRFRRKLHQQQCRPTTSHVASAIIIELVLKKRNNTPCMLSMNC